MRIAPAALLLALAASAVSAEPTSTRPPGSTARAKPVCSIGWLEQNATGLLGRGKTRAAYAYAREMVSCNATPRSYAMLALTACKMFVQTRNARYKPVARRALAKLNATDQSHVAAACVPRDCRECQLE